ncbi:peptidase dimerization domain protein [Stachybotrys elegans]|uniref:Peptidase M20 domain-containing protein 2 n=1 Tax=Stachybotrys elegans TaxID=80388 RepID=A0A8K0T388_9HYPO|nr:peptidase dimerization domain protein [Stachybotrys elegans]
MEAGFVIVPRHGHGPLLSEELDFVAEVDEFVDSLESLLWPLNLFIHDNPELAFKEHKAQDALTNLMQSREGWQVTRSAFGMDTAWLAVYESGSRGPTIAFNAEMDALPGLGHACGHNLIAVASVAAGLASAEVLRRHQIHGKIMIVGTPAEERGGGKIKCLEAGAYTGVDVSIISHPGIFNNSPMVRTTAFVHLNVAYHGRAAHGANSPWLGVNALDALVIAYNAISVLRQQTRPDDVIGLQITNGGNRPNVIHEYASGVAVIRAASSTRLSELQKKIEACFRAGAEATGADVDIEVVPGYMDHMPNQVLAKSYAKYWEALPDLPSPPLPPPGEFTWVKASTDQGNISHSLPSMNVSFAIPPGKNAGPPHTPDFREAAGSKGAFQRAMRVAKGMAGTAIDVCAIPGLLEEVEQQWRHDMGK